MFEIADFNKLRVGVKQTSRALKEHQVAVLIIASDAEQHVTRRIVELATNDAVKIEYVETMKELGRLCQIDVGAAVAVIIK
ncbi:MULTISPECIES: ribosomal L7Ae/L30e/S12e/Gadd45 family protein [unclassified Fusibacter]|uniref:ribosomal L7Ae/L30e/S12e/Gadd45 family protein n=1 Tax=unclassified Fusibacter TaxID=2624464 RepID=UPI001011BA89|nr:MULTISPECIES: ribosomal L7Ae/L30e/S12e/Gadd45 family protein [unclassified Fusibacter]MCK8061682.1 ribosomal L7Ae/L30e/S12e/Gadd45 family protein [Fusibacter sp. A2]NPE21344.1 50S ribosomal protein L7ae-like protein [Fusibacter sp. A1]RXV61761.1 50S ribosomal protein L7ae-like protein [Fusibacter sp. A1]